MFKKLAWAGCLLIAAAGIARAQTHIYGDQLNLLNPVLYDEGVAPPTPGPNDQAQTNLPTGSSNPGTLNYYWTQGWLANSFAPQGPGQSFTTGNNGAGYVLNAVWVQANTFNHASGSYSYPLILNIYALSGPDTSQTGSPYTNATLVAGFENQVITPIIYGDWILFTNISVALLPGTQYAYTINTTLAGNNSYANISFVNGNKYAGGSTLAISLQDTGGFVNYGGVYTYDATFDVGLNPATVLTVNQPTESVPNPVTQGTAVTLTAGTVVGYTGTANFQWQTDGGSGNTPTNIPGATSAILNINTAALSYGNYSFDVKVTDSAAHVAISPAYVLNVITNIPGTLADIGTANPTVGNYDASQLIGTYVPSPGDSQGDALNYYSNNGGSAGNFMGETFTTGTNALGYKMSAVSVKMANGNSSATTTAMAYDLFIYSINNSTATLIAHITNSTAFGFNYGDWITYTFPPITLQSNAVYAYTFGSTLNSGYAGMSATPSVYGGGNIVAIPGAGGPLINDGNALNATFDVSLFPLGVAIVPNEPVATPNPAYALSKVTLTSSAQTSGSYTYQWLTDDGSGAIPPNYIPISGATSTTLTVYPLNIGNGSPYTTNYYVQISDGIPADTAISLPVPLVVNPAQIPTFTATATPTNLVTFAGGSVTYSVTEVGTTPITNQWQLNTGGGYAPLTLQTNTTLALTNLTVGQSGNYQIVATNAFGSTNSAAITPLTLTVKADPAAPASSEAYAYSISTNLPYAYWRLNETNVPGVAPAPLYTAYDYSGHGFDAIYGTAMTVSNAGPSSLTPGFPGFANTELAAGTIAGTGNGVLSVPNLNISNTNPFTPLTFVAWIFPSNTVAGSAGLLFNRGGPNSANGFGFGGTANNLGYTINNSSSTYNFNSGLAVQVGQWNYVAYILTQTNCTMILGYLSGGNPHFAFAVNSVTNPPITFGQGTTWLGGDPNSSSRVFGGLITEAALYTNALSFSQVEQFFLTGIGSSASAQLPTVFGTTVYPSSTVEAGQNVLLTTGFISPQNPTGVQWQQGPDGVTWTNYTGAGNSNSLGTILINPTNVESTYFQMVVTNPAGSVTSSPPVQITFNSLPVTPPGVWTANFEVTNNLFNNGYYAYAVGKGTGHYVGRGILGNGSSWNYIPYVTSTPGTSKNIVSVTDYQDDGATHSGIYCYLNNTYGGSSQTAPLINASDIGNLMYQWQTMLDSPSALQFKGVQDGTYNLAIYSEFGSTANLGTIFVVNDSLNGNQTNSTLNTSAPAVPLAQGANYVLFTNVHVSGGTLNVDTYPNPAASGVNINVEADINGAQLQLVSLDSPPTVILNKTVNGTPGNPTSMVLSWNEGILYTAAKVTGPWTAVYAPSPYTITISKSTAAAFYKVGP